MAVDEFAERVNLPLPEDRDFDTVAGLVLDRMGRLPALGESVAYAGYQMEVVDMDGMRIDKLLVSRINPFVVTQTGDEL